jgi:putative FmdB family regulatory protein
MPIYEYKCDDCGKVFEVIQKISDKKLTICRCDEKGAVHRLVSSSGFQIKGFWLVRN